MCYKTNVVQFNHNFATNPGGKCRTLFVVHFFHETNVNMLNFADVIVYFPSAVVCMVFLYSNLRPPPPPFEEFFEAKPDEASSQLCLNATKKACD